MIKILIAEDDPAMRKILSLYFAREGWAIQTAANGKEASLSLIEAKPFFLTDTP